MIRYALVFAGILFLSSCFKSDDCDPNVYCNTERPDSAWVNITVSYDRYHTPVPYTIYNGNIEDGLVVLRDTAYMNVTSHYLPVNERYSVEATYFIGQATYSAYDGGKLRLNKFWNCNDRCYEAPDLSLDCSLLK